jgi:hypothetical protein
VYVTVYVPAVLVLGVTAPVPALIVNPAGDAVYIPPLVPVKVTGCAVATDLQNGVPAYVMLAVGNAVIVIGVVAVTTAQPPDAAIVLVTV